MVDDKEIDRNFVGAVQNVESGVASIETEVKDGIKKFIDNLREKLKQFLPSTDNETKQTDDIKDMDQVDEEIIEVEPEYNSYVTSKQLEAIGWNDVTDELVEELNRTLEKYDITTVDRIKHFITQVAYESGFGKYRKELGKDSYLEGKSYGKKYSGAGYIQLTWDYEYQAFATYLILNAFSDLNETVSYQNPKNRGRDDIKNAYEKVIKLAHEKGYDIKKYTNIVDVGRDYVAENYAWESAGYYWATKNLNNVVDEGGGGR